MANVPELIEGGLAVDDRGQLLFANDFVLSNYRRFYMIRNHADQFVRAWHGHKLEGKAITVAEGAAIVGAVEIDDWEKPSPSLVPHRYVLSSKKPSVLLIPPGYANGIMTLTPNTIVCVFSSSSVEESRGDDYRFPSRLWDIWTAEER
jgi:dTDP-4-dehydrorhamnose 3,5-epimerase-like enzyme